MSTWVWNPQNRRFDEPPEDIGAWTLVAADSWFVEDGRMRAFDRHRRRFANAAAQVGTGESVSDDFWTSVVEKMPATGEWFPRVDVLEPRPGAEQMLAFRLRPAPSRTQELRVLVPPYPDPRFAPHRKGPDIGLLEQLRTRARTEHACDEVLLLSEDGCVIKGAATSLLWWDEDTLCAPDPELGALPGVTAAVILEEASTRSVFVEFRRVRPETLFDHEVWLVNALHGIRRVVEFVDARAGSGQSMLDLPRNSMAAGIDNQSDRSNRHFELWHDWLDAVSEPAHS